MEQIKLRFGVDGEFSGRLERERLLHRFQGPAAISDVSAVVREAAAAPLDYPPLHQGIVPGDRVVIAMDRHLPEAGAILAGLWAELELRDIAPDQVTVLHPADYSGGEPVDPRLGLPEAIRKDVRRCIHDPLGKEANTYLATTTDGDRIYLSKELVDSDIAILAGRVEFDRIWGYRSLQGVLYPGLSTVEAMRKAHGQPHDEVGADESRPLQQKAEEIAWLLGVQFGISVIPSVGPGASAIYAGQIDSVQRNAVQTVNDTWRFSPGERPELVLVSVDHAAGQGWEQLAAALHTARNIVAKDGRIAVLTQIKAELTEGLQMIRESRKPRDAMRPLREQAPPDLLAATSLAKAVEWANVYLFSELDSDLVEELFMIPLGGLDEVQRLISGEESCVVIESGQYVCAEAAAIGAAFREGGR